MADKSISELIPAEQVTPLDLFVLEQNNTAKKLTGQTLENWLLELAKGNGGILSITKTGTSGLVDTYTITFSNQTTTTFTVTNGKSITGIAKTGTSGLVDTYTITYNTGESTAFEVTNGAKGDTGQAWYVWIKYASQEPTPESHSMGDVPDNWMGIYSGTSSTAPEDWEEYEWFEIKGAKGDTGDPAQLTTAKVEYQTSTSGTVIPSGEWQSTVPTVSPGQFLWTRTMLQFNTGAAVVSYSVSRMGIDGQGAVATVNNISPDGTGNVTLTATDVGAVAKVANKEPGHDGNVTLSATDVGAVAKVNNTAPDAFGNVTLPTDSTPTPDSAKLITSGAVATALEDAQPNTSTVTLPVASWAGEGPYTQTVTVPSVTATSQINITPDATLLQAAMDQGFSLVFGNNGGTITAYAVGANPTTQLSVPVTIQEVR